MSDIAAGVLGKLAKALVKKAGVALLKEKYGDHVLYKETIGPEEVELSEVSIKKVVHKEHGEEGQADQLAEIDNLLTSLQIVDGVTSVIKADLCEQLFEQRVSNAQSKLESIMSWFAAGYPCLGGTAASRDQEISHWERELVLHVMAPLTEGNTSHQLVCLPAYLVAAAIHMAILQERVNLLPDSRRGDLLRFHAKKYMAYAEEVYKRGYQTRMGQISEVVKDGNRSILSKFSSSGRKFCFTDDAEERDSLDQPVKYDWHFQCSSREEEVAEVRMHYMANAQRCFEGSLSRPAMIATFQAWNAEIPGVTSSPLFIPQSPLGGAVDAYIQIDKVQIDVDPVSPLKESLLQPGQLYSLHWNGEIFGEHGGPDCPGLKIGSRPLLPAPHSVEGSTLHFKRPFWIPCLSIRRKVEDLTPRNLIVRIYQWSAKKQDWVRSGINGRSPKSSTRQIAEVAKFVDQKLVATNCVVKEEMLSLSKYKWMLLRYTPSHIHYCAKSS